TDVDNGSPTYALASAAGHGTAGVASNGSWTYQPAANYNGSDSFTFTATDGLLTSDPATVNLTITAVNDKPVCTGLSLATDKNVAVGGTVACTDVEGSVLTLRVSSAPARGTVDPFNAGTG
ncbi:MAG: Ig-like domain-containing protein, partial [Candidatus Limnocylindrales bacterium]